MNLPLPDVALPAAHLATGPQQSPEFLRGVLDHLQDGVYFVDRARRITYWNQGAERITGYPASAVLGHCCADNLLAHVDDAGCALCLTECPLSAAMRGDTVAARTIFLRHREGHRVPVRVRVGVIRHGDGPVVGAVESFSDSTQEVEAERTIHALRRTLLTDPLTGAGNRRQLEARLPAVAAERAAGIPCGVLCLDLDHFKAINDCHGHAVGDDLLQLVVRTLLANVRDEDTVVRMGGEEFLVLLQGVTLDQLIAKGELLRAQVSASSLGAPSESVGVTISIGAALLSGAETTADWLQRADRMLYFAKQRGRNQVAVDRAFS